MSKSPPKSVAIIVAHPDDETLWAGGTILSQPDWKCFVICLSRKSDAERVEKFHKALKVLKCEGAIGDLDDGPDQKPLDPVDVERYLLELMPEVHFDLIITHNPSGEYTRHIRHEEVSRAVIGLWYAGKITTSELWTFAYDDGKKTYYPRSAENAPVQRPLIKEVWLRKYSLLTDTYGFGRKSWEAETTPKTEAFWQFTDPEEANKWMKKFGDLGI